MPGDEGHPPAEERLLTGYAGRLSIALALGWFGIRLGRETLPPLLPSIIDGLSITPSQAGFALTLMWAIYSLQQYPAGRLADQLSRKTVIVGGLAIAVAGMLLLVGVSSYPAFLLAVALVGVGAGLYFVPSRALLSDLFVEKRGQVFGLNQGTGNFGSAAAAGLAVAALAVGAWQGAFLPVAGVLFAVIVMLHVWSDEPYVVRRADLGVRETGLRVFGSPRVLVLLAAYSLFAFAWQGVVSFLPTFLQAVKGFSPTLASSNFALIFVVGSVAALVGGSASDRTNRALLAAGLLALALVGVVGVVLGSSALVVAGSVTLLAAGFRGYPPVMQAHIMDAFPDDSMGGDFGALKTVYTLIGSLGPTYVGLVAERASYDVAYAGLVVCLFAAIGTVLWLAVSE